MSSGPIRKSGPITGRKSGPIIGRTSGPITGGTSGPITVGTSGPIRKKRHGYHGWIPRHPEFYKHFTRRSLKDFSEEKVKFRIWSAPVLAFSKAIRNDAEMIDLFNQSLLQAPEENEVTSFNRLLWLIDDIIWRPPRVEYVVIDGTVVKELVMTWLGNFFDLLSNTAAGYDLLRKTKFNDAMRDLLNSWGAYLSDPNQDSNSTLTDQDDGWFSTASLQALESDGRGTFNDTYVTPDPDATNRGYDTWDAFFAREVQDSARPVDAADNKSLIHSACESFVYRIVKNVQDHDSFWLKGQYYSLYDMLNRDDDYAQQFVGGTVYQAYLSPLDYHRWHAPVDGTIKKAVVVPGTYYAVLPDEGAPDDDPDLAPGDRAGAIVRCQSWLTLEATRALIFIEADNSDIGLICFIGIGMWEVSSCDITVSVGDTVKTGDQLGMFHFGGSSHALIFGPGTDITFADVIVPPNHVKVNSIIGQAAAASSS